MMDKYCYIFYVIHQYAAAADKVGAPICETKEIGVYSTMNKAREAVRRFAGLPGFASYPNDFIISKRKCYLRDRTEKEILFKVYSPYHEKYLPEEDCDDITRGAFFADAAQAEEVVQQWMRKPRFIGHEAGFNVIEYAVDQDIRFWSEGFSK